MELSRIVAVSCIFLLTFCLFLTVCALTTLRAVWKEGVVSHTEEVLQSDTTAVEALPSTAPDEPELSPDESVSVDVLADRFCMRSENGRIAIYTADGYLIRRLELSVEALPAADQEALRQGITVSSWKEILALMQDFDVG